MYQEVASLTTLSSAHCAVPRVLGHNTELFNDLGVELYVAMEYIQGDTLKRVIDSEGTLPLDEAKRLTIKLCDTIRIAHQFPILHRDLKPENIIVRDLAASDVVIVDYGLSFNAVDDQGLTMTNETFSNKFLDLPEANTPGGNKRDSRSDVTAVCAILYYLLTGKYVGQLQGEDGKPAHMRPGYTIREAMPDDLRVSQLESLFNRGFAVNIDNRFQAIDEFVERLNLAGKARDAGEIEDPIFVAKRCSELLLVGDSTTKLKLFERPAEKLFAKLIAHANKYAKNLERFKLTVERLTEEWKELEGLQLVTKQVLRLTITPENHSDRWFVNFVVAAKGDECALLKQAWYQPQGVGLPQSGGEWDPVLWYSGHEIANPDPAIEDIEAWIGYSIQAITNEIMQRQSAP